MSNSHTAVEPGQEFIDGPAICPEPLRPPTKPGWQTSEFWVTILVQVVSILSAMGVLTPDEASHWQSIAATGGGLIASVISAVMYTRSRTSVKNYNCY